MNAGRAGLDVSVIGFPQVAWAGEELKLPTQKSLAVICFLSVLDRAATRQELAELLWPPGGSPNLRPELHRLRRLRGAGEWLEVGARVVLRADTDLVAFESAVARSRHREALMIFPPGEVLLRGLTPKRAPAFDDWLELERRRVSTLLIDVLKAHSWDLERSGAFAEALAHLRQLLDLDPLDESAYRAAMRCEYQRGRHDEALRYFEACRRALYEELGAVPLSETSELANEIERGKPLPFAASPSLTRRPRPLPLGSPRLIGREREWNLLEDAWDAGMSINVSGPRGVGKTRLLLDFARSRGHPFVLEGRPGDRAVPYSSLARALRDALADFPDLTSHTSPWVRSELARILPDVFTGAAAAPSFEGSETRLVEAIAQLMLLLRQRVDAIVVDDLHQVDALSFRAGVGAQARLLAEPAGEPHARLMAAFRSHELPAEYGDSLQASVDHGRAVHLALAPLSRDATRQLLESVGLDDERAPAPDLEKLTGGNPQLVLGTLGRLREAAVEGAALDPSSLPQEELEAIVERRMEGLSALAARLARTLALLGRIGHAQLLARVLGDEVLDVADALAELERAGLLERGDFAHELLGPVVVRLTPAPSRAALHYRLAEALESLSGDPARIAHHWYAAGESERAAKHRLAAAHRSLAEGQFDEALVLLAQAAMEHEGVTQREAGLTLARAYLELDRFEDARDALQSLLQEALSPSLEARANELMASVYLLEGQHLAAETAAKRALQASMALGDEPLALRCRLHLARIAHQQLRLADALELATGLAEAITGSTGAAGLHGEVAALLDDMGRHEDALPLHYQALEEAHAAASPRLLATAKGRLARCLLALAQLGEAAGPRALQRS